jgi:hypothetical protein
MLCFSPPLLGAKTASKLKALGPRPGLGMLLLAGYVALQNGANYGRR